ncbi:MAG: flavin reductase family protein [Candidatus Bathyarchaeia archaeon]
MKKTSLKNAGLLFPTVATLVTCVDEEGKANIITLGWSMKTSGDPPMVAISVKPSRYSHDLIATGREFVLAIPTMEIVEELHYCGRHTGREVDKFKETGLTPVPAEKVRPPLIRECAANLECRVVSQMTTGDHTIFVGEVVAAHVNETVFDEERECLDLDKAKAIVTHSNEYRGVGSYAAYKLNGDIKVL